MGINSVKANGLTVRMTHHREVFGWKAGGEGHHVQCCEIRGVARACKAGRDELGSRGLYEHMLQLEHCCKRCRLGQARKRMYSNETQAMVLVGNTAAFTVVLHNAVRLCKHFSSHSAESSCSRFSELSSS